MTIVKISKFLCLADAKKFAFRYFVLVTAFSYVFNHVSTSSPFLAPARTILNNYFSKYNVFYVVTLLFVFEFSILHTLESGKRRAILFALFRAALNMGAFVLVNKIFAYAGSLFGKCVGDAQFDNQNVMCVGNHRAWKEYKISGHTYGAFYLLLVIFEHSSVFDTWEQVDDIVRRKRALGQITIENDDERSLLEDVCDNPRGFTDVEKLIRSHKTVSPFVRTLFFLLAGVTVLLHLEMVFAVICYRHFDQKIAGILIAMLQWFVLYRQIYALYDMKIDFNRGEILDYVLHLEQNTEKYNSIDEEEFENTLKERDDYRKRSSLNEDLAWWSRLKTKLFGRRQSLYDNL